MKKIAVLVLGAIIVLLASSAFALDNVTYPRICWGPNNMICTSPD